MWVVRVARGAEGTAQRLDRDKRKLRMSQARRSLARS